MAEKFYSLLTKIGKAKIANSIGFGTKINFTKMKVGDGGGSYYEPTEEQTDLKNTVWEGNINHVEIDKDNLNWIHIELMIPATVGGFTIREYGAFDDENNLIGICKCAETYKPVITDGSTKELLLDLILCVVNTENIQLKIDPTIIFAKKSDLEVLDNKINNIKIPVTKVNEKTGDITLKAEDINCNDGKSVESHLDEMTTKQEELFQSVSNGKKELASAITDRGVKTLVTDKFNVMSANVRKIKTGYTSGDKITLDKLKIIYKANSKAYVKGNSTLDNYGVYEVYDFIPTLDKDKVLIRYCSPSTYNEYIGIHDVKKGTFSTVRPTSKEDVYYDFYDNTIYATYFDMKDTHKTYINKYDFNGNKIFSKELGSLKYKKICIDKMNNNVYAFRTDQYDTVTHLDKIDTSTGSVLLSISIDISLPFINLIYDNKMYCGKFSTVYDINNFSAGANSNYVPSNIDKILYEKEKGIFLMRKTNNDLVEYNVLAQNFRIYKNITNRYKHIYFNDDKEYAYYMPFKSDVDDWISGGSITKYSLKEEKEIYVQNILSPTEFGANPVGIYSAIVGEIYLFYHEKGSYGKLKRDRIVEDKEIEAVIIN